MFVMNFLNKFNRQQEEKGKKITSSDDDDEDGEELKHSEGYERN